MKNQPYTFTIKKSNRSKIKKRKIKINKSKIKKRIKSKIKKRKIKLKRALICDFKIKIKAKLIAKNLKNQIFIKIHF